MKILLAKIPISVADLQGLDMWEFIWKEMVDEIQWPYKLQLSGDSFPIAWHDLIIVPLSLAWHWLN
jgi:hypothetical protein